MFGKESGPTKLKRVTLEFETGDGETLTRSLEGEQAELWQQFTQQISDCTNRHCSGDHGRSDWGSLNWKQGVGEAGL